MHADLEKALFQSRTRGALLDALLRDGVVDSLSGLARRTGCSQHAVAVEVRNLESAGLLTREAQGKADVVRANRSHPAVVPLVRLLSIADDPPSADAASATLVRESVASYGAPARSPTTGRRLPLEKTVVRALALARQDPELLAPVAVLLVRRRHDIRWDALRQDARKHRLKAELGLVAELAAEASGRLELKAAVASLADRRRTVPVHFARPRNEAEAQRVVAQTPPEALRWGFYLRDPGDSLRTALRKGLPPAGRRSLAAARSAEAERIRLRAMTALERASIALELGEFLGHLARRRS